MARISFHTASAFVTAAGIAACATGSHLDTSDTITSHGLDTGPIPVEIVQDGRSWTMLRDGEPYVVLGAGGQDHLERLVEAGGNSIRTWDAEGIGPLLDRAQELGLTVTAGIWLQHARHGFDYSDPASRQAQLDRVRRLVLEHKDHPALLMWGVGNEVEHEADIDTAARSVEEAAALIKSLDPLHPTMSVVAGAGKDKVARYRALCPSIDVFGVNSYGDATNVPSALKAQGYEGPYLLTEYGPRGHWEGPKTEWGAPIEPTSAMKARQYAESYREAVASQLPRACLGSYVFLWGQKQETTATWFGMFLPTGESLPTLDVMQKMWTGKMPENTAPIVSELNLLGVEPGKIKPGQTVRVAAKYRESDGDTLRFVWNIVPETTDRRSGGDKERAPEAIEALHVETDGPRAELRMPEEPGPYRVFLEIHDDRGCAGDANVPVLVVAND